MTKFWHALLCRLGRHEPQQYHHMIGGYDAGVRTRCARCLQEIP